MGIFSHHEPCSRCGSMDNRAVYKDGGSYCFGCGFIGSVSVSGFVQELSDEDEPTWKLPDDLTQDFPEDVLAYIKQYDLTVEELIKYGYYFSKWPRGLWRVLAAERSERSLDVLPSELRRSGGKCVAAEFRRIGGSTKGPKSRFYGSKAEASAIAGTERPSGQLVLTEDSLSSIKVGRVTHAAPLFGTSLNNYKLVRFAKDYQQVVVWLDHDKFKEAWEIALRFKWLGKETKVVLTSLDPKCYSETEITEYLK